MKLCLNECDTLKYYKYNTYSLIQQGFVILMDVDRLWESINGRQYSDYDIYKSLYTHIGYAKDHVEHLMSIYPKESLITEYMLVKELNAIYSILFEIKDKYFEEQ